MMGDADNFIANDETNNENNGGYSAKDKTRLQNSLDFLRNYNAKHILFRRRAAEDIRLVLTSRPNADDESFKNDIIDVFHKILKKPKEDILVLEQILWTITNLSHANSEMIHDMLPRGMVPLIASHAKNSTAHAVRDQAIMCLGNIATDCQECRGHVLKTNSFQTIVDLLQTPTNLTATQRDHFAWTLQNIIRPASPEEHVAFSLENREKMLKLVYGLITLPQPDDSIIQGVEILHDWITIDPDKDVGFAVVGNKILMNNLLQIFGGDDDDASSKVIRTMGNIAFNDDDVIQHIIDYGFVAAMEVRLKTSGTTLGADIIWCLSNILGSLRPTCVTAVYERKELWEYLIKNCYSYDFHISREAIFCVINVCTFYQGEVRTELYQKFFGRLIIDILVGFLQEENASMVQAVQGILIHTIEEMKRKNPLYLEMITDYGFEKAIQKRYEWTQKTISNFDVGTNPRKELYKLLNLCVEALNLI